MIWNWTKLWNIHLIHWIVYQILWFFRRLLNFFSVHVRSSGSDDRFKTNWSGRFSNMNEGWIKDQFFIVVFFFKEYRIEKMGKVKKCLFLLTFYLVSNRFLPILFVSSGVVKSIWQPSELFWFDETHSSDQLSVGAKFDQQCQVNIEWKEDNFQGIVPQEFHLGS